ncbi:hypothetical protein ATK17_3760 [Branchiibius hedensis]|uniref:Uncharacterized protein n=1 Tax=Branchiibius hedensis TaxID=672460 RepID=A0A2Y9CAW2_9MICO|nr:hypothetical protein [Branchiibius hedensis]PWJ23267.1 hypothetical protein ATK17_3760 [Branchiibius hedensis]SSA58956.1 hypothetical protein SAMN04489750_3760 [Branchiibius hedensis]
MSAQLDGTVGWDRRRLLLVLGAVIAAGVALVFGLGFAIYFAFASATSGGSDATGATPGPQAAHGPASGQAHRDAVAAEPMLKVDPGAAQPAPPAAVAAANINIPGSTTQGPAGIPSGFPHTPEGAIGQLAAIEQVVLQSMSIQQANTIHANWTLPGAPGIAQWPLTQNVQAFLGSAQMGGTLDPTSTVVVTPVGAQVKGTDGPDWVLACVLVKVHATITQDAQMGYGYCERMQWHSGRWMIAPGATPAPAPSTWPGSDISNKAGWKTWPTGGDD